MEIKQKPVTTTFKATTTSKFKNPFQQKVHSIENLKFIIYKKTF